MENVFNSKAAFKYVTSDLPEILKQYYLRRESHILGELKELIDAGIIEVVDSDRMLLYRGDATGPEKYPEISFGLKLVYRGKERYDKLADENKILRKKLDEILEVMGKIK